MVRNQAVIPLRNLIVALGALAVSAAASAQPTDLYECVVTHNVTPRCYDVRAGLIFASSCPSGARRYEVYIGQFGWHPLRNLGPIEVEVETASSASTYFPLYVEIVPLAGVNPGDVCQNIPGYALMTIYPRYGNLCGFTDTSGIVDISAVVPIGGTYAVRLYAFRHAEGHSPGIDCVRVTSHPVRSSVVREMWGRVKWLYQ
jgi:hypothetical protein